MIIISSCWTSLFWWKLDIIYLHLNIWIFQRLGNPSKKYRGILLKSITLYVCIVLDAFREELQFFYTAVSNNGRCALKHAWLPRKWSVSRDSMFRSSTSVSFVETGLPLNMDDTCQFFLAAIHSVTKHTAIALLICSFKQSENMFVPRTSYKLNQKIKSDLFGQKIFLAQLTCQGRLTLPILFLVFSFHWINSLCSLNFW